MKRRNLLNLGLLANLPLIHSNFAKASSYSEKFLLSLAADGGWDVTLFCDPKINQVGEKIITNWSEKDDIQEIGNLKYAPFAKNAKFFEKYYKDMFVINGVDHQTNAHGIGVTNAWSGRTASGYPSIGALYAAVQNKSVNLPMPYLSFGGYSYTADLIIPTVASNPGDLKSLMRPHKTGWNGDNKIDDDYFDLIKTMLIKDAINKTNEISTLDGNYKKRLAYLKSIQNFDKLEPFGQILPDRFDLVSGDLKSQAQVALLAFKSGVTISADIREGGMDSHDNNDSQQSDHLINIVETIDYIWTSAEELGIADRLILVVGSDFSRTPFYNSANGKDHWNIGSYIFMEKYASYTNQTIGETDEFQNAYAVNIKTNLVDEKGINITTAHVHKSLRSYLGIDTDPLTLKFPLDNIELFDFFI